MEVVKNNAEFIRKYGRYEFREMCKFIPRDLIIAKLNKEIGSYKINNTKKRVMFYVKNGSSFCLDFATIFTLGCNHIENYINKIMGDNK